jgi:hypothetical protein
LDFEEETSSNVFFYSGMFTTLLFNSCIIPFLIVALLMTIKKTLQYSPYMNLDEIFGSIIEEITTKEDFIGKSQQSTFAKFERYGFKIVGFVGLEKLEANGSSIKFWQNLGKNVVTHLKTTHVDFMATLIIQSKSF